jgi:transposase
VYSTDDPDIATERLDDAIAWCTAAEAGPELRRLAKTLRRWRTEIIAHHSTGASKARSRCRASRFLAGLLSQS